MFLKREVRRKDGKEHVYYCLAETTRVGRDRMVQRRLLNLGELNTTQIDRWQRSIEVIEEDGRACQRRLFSDREGRAPQQEDDVCEVVLSAWRCADRGYWAIAGSACDCGRSWALIRFGFTLSEIGAERWNGPR